MASKLVVEKSNNVLYNTEYYPGGLKKSQQTPSMKLPTWGVFVILIISFFLLKKLIYIKDDKRHGK